MPEPRLALALLLLALTPGGVAGAEIRIAGEVVQGGLVTGQAPPGSVVHLGERELLVSPQGYFAFGFGRDDTAAVVLEVVLPDGKRHSQTLMPGRREFDVQHIDGLPPSQVTPPPEVLERIRDDARIIGRARQRFEHHQDWTEGFDWPLAGRITGVYGSQRILNGEPRQPHFGIDIAAPEGTPIHAPAGGVVAMVHADMYYSGATLLIDHGHGISTTYLHMSRILVEAGQQVRRGEVIGEVGATGRATGPHLCWRLNWGGVRLDPALLVPPMPDAR